MGCGMSVEEKEGRQRNEEIENQLRKDRMSQKNEIKMLLLGMSCSFDTIIRTTTTTPLLHNMGMLMMIFFVQEPESLANLQFSNK